MKQEEDLWLLRHVCVNAYRNYSAYLNGGEYPIKQARFREITEPRVGDLVMEISTIYMPEYDARRIGWLRTLTLDPVYTEEQWKGEGGVDEPIPKRKVWRLGLLADGSEFAWHNARFIRVFDNLSPSRGIIRP